MKNYLLFLFSLSSLLILAAPFNGNNIKEATYEAKVKTITENGKLKCEFSCIIDMSYSEIENTPSVYFQVGTISEPSKYALILLDDITLKSITKNVQFSNKEFSLQLDLGEIIVEEGYIASIAMFENGMKKVINLEISNSKNTALLKKEKEIKEYGLCKAELFLRKINFDRLYIEHSYLLD